MKTEDQAWRALRDHASGQLHGDFAERVLRSAHGPRQEAWQQLHTHAAARIRPGFSERVLRAARDLTASVPSLFDQVALGAATVAICLVAVVVIHARSTRLEEEKALARWEQLAVETQDLDQGQ